MYAAGNLPNHVTRYNHKCESRWLVPPREPRRYTLRGLMEGILFGLCGAGLIVSALFILQAV